MSIVVMDPAALPPLPVVEHDEDRRGGEDRRIPQYVPPAPPPDPGTGAPSAKWVTGIIVAGALAVGGTAATSWFSTVNKRAEIISEVTKEQALLKQRLDSMEKKIDSMDTSLNSTRENVIVIRGMLEISQSNQNKIK